MKRLLMCLMVIFVSTSLVFIGATTLGMMPKGAGTISSVLVVALCILSMTTIGRTGNKARRRRLTSAPIINIDRLPGGDWKVIARGEWDDFPWYLGRYLHVVVPAKDDGHEMYIVAHDGVLSKRFEKSSGVIVTPKEDSELFDLLPEKKPASPLFD